MPTQHFNDPVEFHQPVTIRVHWDNGIGNWSPNGPWLRITNDTDNDDLVLLYPDGSVLVNAPVLQCNGKIIVGGGVSWTRGAGAPTADEPDGSVYSQTGNGGALWFRQGGAWVEK